MKNALCVHVDMDSPRQLYEFYGIDESLSSDVIDEFYKITVNNMLLLFDSLEVKATFFVVGEDIKRSDTLEKLVRKLHIKGHEIANHTYSHPLGLSNSGRDKIEFEITECSNIIKDVIGKKPVGFRSPGYGLNEFLIDILEEQSFKYDSSAFYTILNPLIKLYHDMHKKNNLSGDFGDVSHRLPSTPYYPSGKDLCKKGPVRKILELPLPRTKILQLPFYNNFHLLVPDFHRRLALTMMRREFLIYLFHAAEFGDIYNGIPGELKMHSNVTKRVADKMKIMKDTLIRLKERYVIARTDEYVERFKNM